MLGRELVTSSPPDQLPNMTLINKY